MKSRGTFARFLSFLMVSFLLLFVTPIIAESAAVSHGVTFEFTAIKMFEIDPSWSTIRVVTTEFGATTGTAATTYGITRTVDDAAIQATLFEPLAGGVKGKMLLLIRIFL